MAEAEAEAAAEAERAGAPRVGAWLAVRVEQALGDTLLVTLSCGQRRFAGVLIDCDSKYGAEGGGAPGGGGGSPQGPLSAQRLPSGLPSGSPQHWPCR